MRIIILSFCLLFTLQVQASFFPNILSWISRLSHGGPVSGTSSPVQKDTTAENNKATSPVTSGAVETGPWTHTGYEPMNVEGIRSGLLLKKQSLADMIPRHRERPSGSNQPPIEEATFSAAQDVAPPTEALITQSSIPEQVTTASHLETRARSEDVSDDEFSGCLGSDMGSAVCVGYVIASDPDYIGYRGLRRAIDEGRLDIAVKLGKQDETLGKAGVDYMIRTGKSDLIANFVNQTNQANENTLKKVWDSSPIETFEEVLEKVDFPQQALIDLASSYDGLYSPETFLVLLNKIVKPEDQEKAIGKAIERLAHNYAETSPLLDALKGKTFRSERLEYLAIQKAFMEGVRSGKVYLLPDDICNHAAITPELYADALIEIINWLREADIRQFLLKQADQNDLQAVKEKAGYADLYSESRDVIEEALKTAAPGGTRTKDIERMEKAEETFEKLESPQVPPEIVDLINAYVLADTQTPRRKAQIATKKVASDVTSTLPKIEGSGDIGSERVGEDQA